MLASAAMDSACIQEGTVRDNIINDRVIINVLKTLLMKDGELLRNTAAQRVGLLKKAQNSY